MVVPSFHALLLVSNILFCEVPWVWSSKTLSALKYFTVVLVFVADWTKDATSGIRFLVPRQ